MYLLYNIISYNLIYVYFTHIYFEKTRECLTFFLYAPLKYLNYEYKYSMNIKNLKKYKYNKIVQLFNKK